MLPDSPLGSWHQARAEDALGSSSIAAFIGCGPAEFSSLMLQGPGWTLSFPSQVRAVEHLGWVTVTYQHSPAFGITEVTGTAAILLLSKAGGCTV